MLVAGCGHGMEAAYIHDELQVTVDAFDVWLHRGMDLPVRDRLTLYECDISNLPFDNETYDIVFYHHVIEHVPDPVASLRELSRVSKQASWMFIGTPNRHRLVGAIGAHERSLVHKIKVNLHDWKMRLLGRFRNEHGAHAGFSVRELDGMLADFYDTREWVTADYLRYKYNAGLRKHVALAMTAGVWQEIAVPSIYALCSRGQSRKGLDA